MCHPLSSDAQYHIERPFDSFKIDNNDILSTVLSRYICDNCNKSRKFFCYTCYLVHPDLKRFIPQVKIDIIKHAKEIDGKSTAAHAAILAAEDVTVYTYPNIPSYEREQVVVIFPSSRSLSIPELFQCNAGTYLEMLAEWNTLGTCKKSNPGTMKTHLNDDGETASKMIIRPHFPGTLPIAKAVFIDSTWNQSKGIYKDERIHRLPCVVLQNRISQFWRHQKGSPRWYLATVEAIHQFLVEMHVNAFGVSATYNGLASCLSDEGMATYSAYSRADPNAYSGEYDNLLYFFEYMYKLIHTYYDHDQLYAYTRRLK